MECSVKIVIIGIPEKWDSEPKVGHGIQDPRVGP